MVPRSADRQLVCCLPVNDSLALAIDGLVELVIDGSDTALHFMTLSGPDGLDGLINSDRGFGSRFDCLRLLNVLGVLVY